MKIIGTKYSREKNDQKVEEQGYPIVTILVRDWKNEEGRKTGKKKGRKKEEAYTYSVNEIKRQNMETNLYKVIYYIYYIF